MDNITIIQNGISNTQPSNEVITLQKGERITIKGKFSTASQFYHRSRFWTFVFTDNNSQIDGGITFGDVYVPFCPTKKLSSPITLESLSENGIFTQELLLKNFECNFCVKKSGELHFTLMSYELDEATRSFYPLQNFNFVILPDLVDFLENATLPKTQIDNKITTILESLQKELKIIVNKSF